MAVVIKFLDNCHEADLVTLRLPLRIKDSDKKWATGAEPILIIQGTLQEFHLKGN